MEGCWAVPRRGKYNSGRGVVDQVPREVPKQEGQEPYMRDELADIPERIQAMPKAVF